MNNQTTLFQVALQYTCYTSDAELVIFSNNL